MSGDWSLQMDEEGAPVFAGQGALILYHGRENVHVGLKSGWLFLNQACVCLTDEVLAPSQWDNMETLSPPCSSAGQVLGCPGCGL